MSRVAELDGLRGIAILLVVAYHAGSLGLGGGGTAGVTLFFVLSGYLITRLLRRELDHNGALDLRAFWARRARRLVPALVPLAAFTVILFAVLGSFRGFLVVAATPVADYLRVFGVPLAPLNHTWSLAVEEQFYLVWPFVLAWLVTRQRPLVWVATAALASGAWRATLALSGHGMWAYHGLDTNAFALLAGAGLALWGGVLSWRWGAGAILALCAWAWMPWSSTWTTVTAPLAAALGLVAVAGARGVPGLAWAPLRWVGVVSYGWYLWHWALLSLLDSGPQWWRWVACGVALGIAAMSWRLIERPFLMRGRTGRAAVLDGPLPEASSARLPVTHQLRLGPARVNPLTDAPTSR